MIRIRDAVLDDSTDLIDGNARMARETEGLELDTVTLAAGVRAVLRDEAKGQYWIAETGASERGDGPWTFAGQIMITHEWSDWRNGDLWWIQSVFVVPTQRRRGVFRALYQHVREKARQQGAVGLRLYVEKNNAPGHATYHNMGMEMTHYGVMEEIFEG